MQTFRVLPFAPPPGSVALREEIRAFIAENMPHMDAPQRVNSWAVGNREFSRALGRAGYIGMTWPKRYGGRDRHPLERYIVLEELLAAGAPVGMHWIADRQSGPLILRFGTEEQRMQFLPRIAAGELFGCIGMSEPGTGSDLASVRMRAVRDGDSWRVNGQKVWTTNAHNAGLMIALLRTGEAGGRHEGLTQFLVDLTAPGVTVRPIIDLAGGHDFNEVFFDDVLIPDTMRVGAEGDGWKQVTAELSLERSGPERYMSCFGLFLTLIQRAGANPDAAMTGLIGRLSAELWTLRQMSMSAAAQLAAGNDPMLEAAIVKDLGNSFEQELPRLVQAAADADMDLSANEDFARLLALLLQISPSFSLRGGTREILRGIIARNLGLR
ncbi:MAG: Acyl-CoA dehydrogenase-like protein [Rhodospirillales bacterium]|nr:Acyl-CoA dehydrogenase-like protein [Rhodospirillales bacterium]